MEKRASSQVCLWLNSLGKGEQEPERRLSTHLNPTCDSPAQVSYSGGSKMSLRGVFTDLVTPTHRPLGRQIHRYRIAFLVASVAMARVEVTGLHFSLCHTKFMEIQVCTNFRRVCSMRAWYEQMMVEVVIMERLLQSSEVSTYLPIVFVHLTLSVNLALKTAAMLEKLLLLLSHNKITYSYT